ncbi:MAG: cobyric acid synthase [Dethiobacter sp.]|jgi:adenosylcobyric acid synthase|nr:cobyric acid synthase [Dethiobacter sp.]MBS3900531.1 cobyric acid synthase [Dethiobacter sp.]MBS3989363.1 cobyric acid synthase [Dethiobacter sp.]
MTKGAVLMVQGTSSDAGKTLLVAALCRYFSDLGYATAPFKGQNMALNAVAVARGEEISWAQVMQAEAARTEPTVEMNPLLLKPVSDTVSQVVLRGRVVGDFSAQEYQAYKATALPIVLDALNTLRRRYDLVVLEGAGSPAEVNLRSADLVNMGLAAAANAPVLLISDIDRGGMFAYVVGTLALLTDSERARVCGLVVNRFRGELERLQPGLDSLFQLTGLPLVGVIPYLSGLSLPAEDSLGIKGVAKKTWDLDVAVIRLPRIANFSDLHILEEEEGVRLRYIMATRELGRPQLIILPGTKNTIADLAWLRETGLDEAIGAAVAGGAFVLGICGGYQLLGKAIRDPHGVDGAGGAVSGLGLLPLETDFLPEKTILRVSGETVRHREALEGYKIHFGQSIRQGVAPFARLIGDDGNCYEDGACSEDGRVMGTYLHGLFDAVAFRNGYLNRVRKAFMLPTKRPGLAARAKRESSYCLLADAVRRHLDCDFLLKLLHKQGETR